MKVSVARTIDHILKVLMLCVGINVIVCVTFEDAVVLRRSLMLTYNVIDYFSFLVE